MIWIIVGMIVWYLIGICSFIYWLTGEYDLMSDDIGMVIFIGLIGPIAFIAGAVIHGNSHKPKIIMKRRGKR